MEAFLSISTDMTYEMMDAIRSNIRTGINRVIDSGVKIRKGQSLAIKINNLGPFSPDTAACTHPQVLRAVIEEFKLLDLNITVYEDCLSEDYVEASGIKAVIEDTGVTFVNLKNRPYTKVLVEGETYEYSSDILQADYLVTVPKMKTHVLTNYTGAIKLMYGSITKQQRKMFHCHDNMREFSKILVDIYSIKLPILVVLDGIISMDGIGPSHGNPNNSGLLMVSDDGVLLDYFASSFMKYKPLEIESIRIALERGLSKCEPDEITLIGDSLPSPNTSFTLIPVLSEKLGKRYRSIVIGELLLKEELCTGCGICIQSCPFNAISMAPFPVTDYDKCIRCYCCLELCPQGAYSLQRKLK